MLVYSGNAQKDFRGSSGIPRKRQADGPGATLTVTYDDCRAWLDAGSVFAGGGIWCSNKMGCTPCTDCGEVMVIKYEWTGGFDLITSTAFLGNTLGWHANGISAAYMLWQDFSIPGTGGHEDYYISAEDALTAGAWTTSTVLALKADWWLTMGSAVTVTVTYNGVTSPPLTITPGFNPTGTPAPAATTVATVTVFDDGTFTLSGIPVFALIYHFGDRGEGSPDFPFFTRFASGPTPLVMNTFWTRDGYVFAGWNTARDGSGTHYADGAIYPYDAPGGNIWGMWTPSP